YHVRIAGQNNGRPMHIPRAIHPLPIQAKAQPDVSTRVGYKISPGRVGVIIEMIALIQYEAGTLHRRGIGGGMNEIASSLGYHLLFCQSNESCETEIVNIRQLISCRVDGLLVSVSRETTDVSEFEKVIQKRIPLVFFDRAPTHIEASKVIVNQYDGAFRAVEHLIEMGCRRIAHLAGPAGLSISDERMKGYEDALRKNGLSP